MFDQLKEAQEKIEAAKRRLDELIVRGVAEGGKVVAEVSAGKRLKSISISEEIVGDKDQIEDLVVVAINRALESAEKAAEAEMQSIAKDLLPGGLSSLGKMFGK